MSWNIEPEDQVSLIASGYEWICPSCDHDNKIGWIPVVGTAIGEVKCDNCGKCFSAESYDHAFHTE